MVGVRADLPVEWTCPQFFGQDGLWWPTCTAKLNCLQTFHHWVIQFFSNTPWMGSNTASKSLEGKFVWKVWQCLRYEQIPVLIGGGGWEAFLSCSHVAAVQEINLLPDCLLLGASIPPVHKHHHNRRIILHVMAWLFFHGPLYSDACSAFSFNTGILGHPKLLFCLANFCFHFEGMKHLRNLESKNM